MMVSTLVVWLRECRVQIAGVSFLSMSRACHSLEAFSIVNKLHVPQYCHATSLVPFPAMPVVPQNRLCPPWAISIEHSSQIVQRPQLPAVATDFDRAVAPRRSQTGRKRVGCILQVARSTDIVRHRGDPSTVRFKHHNVVVLVVCLGANIGDLNWRLTEGFAVRGI